MDLLPRNATPWEGALADALDTTTSLTEAIAAIRGTKLLSPPPSFLPFLIYEYGLGELTPFVPNLYDLIAEGIDWQRIRGTPAAIALGLSWIGYTAILEEEDVRRRYWNLFQLELDRVRDTRADLDRIAGIAGLSVPIRSRFWRGYHGHDIRPLTFGQSHFGASHYGEYSGRRLTEAGPLWSFGRVHELNYEPTQTDLVAAGVWIEQLDYSVEQFGLADWWLDAPTVEFEEEASSSIDLDWGDFSWESTEASWESTSALARSQAMATGILNRPIWFTFFDNDDAVIGHRRARAQKAATATASGPYELAGVRYAPSETITTSLYLECLTGFGDGDGRTASSVGLTLDGAPADAARPGTVWLDDEAMLGGTTIARQDIAIAFGESIREHVKMILRF